MSELWRMERKRDKNVREMKVQGLEGNQARGAPLDTVLSSPAQRRPNFTRASYPTHCGEHNKGGQPAPGGWAPLALRPTSALILARSPPGSPSTSRRKCKAISHAAPDCGSQGVTPQRPCHPPLPPAPGEGQSSSQVQGPIPGLGLQDFYLLY